MTSSVDTLKKIRSIKRFLVYDAKPDPGYSSELMNPGFTKPPRITLFGIETEIGPSEDELYDELRERVGKYAAIHEDSGAWEVDSLPLTYVDSLKYLEALLGKPFKYANKQQSSNWGMHIHISAESCRDEHLKRMLTTLCDNSAMGKKLLTKIAGRSVERSWGYLPTTDKLKNTITANHNNTVNKSGNLVSYDYDPATKQIIVKEEPIEKVWTKLSPYDRDGIYINSSHKTHEFRFFRSTVDAEKAKANLQFVKSLVDFTRKNEGNIFAWKKFVEDNNTRYVHLYSWMRKAQLS